MLDELIELYNRFGLSELCKILAHKFPLLTQKEWRLLFKEIKK
jgi:hypothetical protein